MSDTTRDAVSFDRFMADALYGPAGFYTAGGRAGRRGDFITSPEVGPLFGAVVARFLDAEWDRIGRPDPFTVVDAGAGPGTLARSVLAAVPACAPAMRFVAVEVAAAQREQHPDGVESAAELPDGSFDGVVFANELLDNLPFRLAVFDDGWREAYVVELPDGRLVEQLSAPFEPTPDVLPSAPSLGARAPLQDGARRWVEAARSRLSSGSVVAIDYAVPTTAELAARPWREWLRTYRGHERGGHYLADPGAQDITSEVAIDQLPEPDAVRTQAQWLQLHGIDELVVEGKLHWEQHAAQPDVAAIRMRSRVSEAEALLDPAGLGSFSVLEWRA
ncbi:MAG: SAM-dependent methyltransferase [Ilumatobacter sp.]|uniref:SAM-dependent methyltransferase n=1 Tax=Ilumatobacter sp. TaxID=1967498 RepID=UPI00261408DA|nr:SAM-dependent methyltransferase [Ilumatobacter sp.]MDJ0769286.1 SAM-dependent methyltransferase [Ilumatobacter sp.]